jgi:membrane associated rhomboid family serine protease
MFPLRDVIPSRTTPVVTIGIIVASALAWLYELALPEDVLHPFLLTYGVVPADFHAPTLATSIFLHGSWSHIIGNMWYLWIFGDNIEDRLGHGRFVVFYLLCGIVAALGHVAMEPESRLPTIGASGAIAGVMGAYFVLFPRSRVLTLVVTLFIDIVEVPATLLLGFWFVLQLLNTSVGAIAVTSGGSVAFAAHVAGFAAGAGGVFLFRKRRAEWELE